MASSVAIGNSYDRWKSIIEPTVCGVAGALLFGQLRSFQLISGCTRIQMVSLSALVSLLTVYEFDRLGQAHNKSSVWQTAIILTELVVGATLMSYVTSPLGNQATLMAIGVAARIAALNLTTAILLNKTASYIASVRAHSADKMNKEALLKIQSAHLSHLNKSDSKGRTLMHCFAQNGLLEAMKILHKRVPLLLKRVDPEGKTPMHYAAQNNQIEVMKYLSAQAPELRTRADHRGRTPMYYAKTQAKQFL